MAILISKLSGPMLDAGGGGGSVKTSTLSCVESLPIKLQRMCKLKKKKIDQRYPSF